MTQRPDDREAEIRRLFPLVRVIAKRLARTISGAELGDLIGDGSVGLIRAVDAFDPARGVPLESYARKVVLGAMLNGLRRRDPLSERARRTIRRATEEQHELAQVRGELPTMVEMEQRRKGLRRARVAAQAAAALSLDAPIPIDQAALVDEGSDPAELVLLRSVEREVREAIELLPPRQRRIVMLYYYNQLSLHAIGGRLNVSPQRASQLHLAALKRLRAQIRVR